MTQVCHLIGGVYQRTAICCRSSCKWLLQVRPFATVYFTFLAFQCCQMLSKKHPWERPLIINQDSKTKHGVSTNWPNIANKFAKRGTNQSLLLSNWSSWHRAASATQLMESGCTLGDSGTPGCSASDVAGLRQLLGLGPHCYHWKRRPTDGRPPLKTAPDHCSRWVLRSFSCRWCRCWSRYGQEQQ